MSVLLRRYYQLLAGFQWLTVATKQAIMDAFGADGTAVIRATNEYLNGIAASDKAKATALAGFIDEDPMMVCSLGLEPQGVTMPVRYMFNNSGVTASIDTEIVPTPRDIITAVWKSAQNGDGYMVSTVGNWNDANPNNHWLFLKTNNTIELWSFSYVQNIANDVDTLNNLCSIVINLKNKTCVAKVGSTTYSTNISVYNAASNQPTIKLGTRNTYNEWHEYTIERDGEQIANLVPVLHNGIVQMVNLASASLCPKTGEGYYTIAYTRNGQPWTPPTP